MSVTNFTGANIAGTLEATGATTLAALTATGQSNFVGTNIVGTLAVTGATAFSAAPTGLLNVTDVSADAGTVTLSKPIEIIELSLTTVNSVTNIVGAAGTMLVVYTKNTHTGGVANTHKITMAAGNTWDGTNRAVTFNDNYRGFLAYFDTASNAVLISNSSMNIAFAAS